MGILDINCINWYLCILIGTFINLIIGVNMKSFLIGLLGFAVITGTVYSVIWVFESLGLSAETISTIGLVFMLLVIAKPFGELTESVFKRIR